MERTHNIYRVDDVLLSGAKLTAILIPIGLTALMHHAARTAADAPPDLLTLATMSLAAMLCPIALWLAGRHVRSAEQRILALHELLQSRGEVPATSLISDIGFTRAALKRAIRLLNAERVGYYTWDDRTDVIRDARVQPRSSTGARCGACGASFSFILPGKNEILPACTYCQTPVDAEVLAALRRATPDSEPSGRASGERAQSAQARPFSLPIFALLMVFCWPAAIVYAVMRSRVAAGA